MQTKLLLLLVCVPLIGAVASSPVALADDGKPTPKEVADLFTAMEAKDWTGALEQIENKRALVHAKRGDRGNSPLLYAARDGELAAVRAILKLGADVNARNTNGQTALHAAAGKGHKEIVALLLANKAEIEARTKRKMTPLYYAAYAGRTVVTDYLVDKGASPKDFAFYILARSGSVGLIQKRLAAGAKIDATDKQGRTALHHVAETGGLAAAEFLIKTGAAVDALDNDARSPLHSAAAGGHVEMIELLLKKGADAAATTKDGTTPLLVAAERGHVDVARLLLEGGADIDARGGPRKWTPLLVAALAKRKEMIDFLVSKNANAAGINLLNAANSGSAALVDACVAAGARVDIRATNSLLPLHLAVAGGHADVIEALLRHKSAVDGRAQLGITPLHIAAKGNRVVAAEALLKGGADVNLKMTTFGYAPLHTAARAGATDVVKLLLQHEAELDIKNTMGQTPLASLISTDVYIPGEVLQPPERKHAEAADLLVAAGADVEGVPLRLACRNGSLELVKKCVVGGAGINAVHGPTKRTPLATAAFYGHANIIEYLIDQGADVRKSEAFHSAAGKGRVGIVRTFLKMKIDVDLKDEFGQTPLYSAAFGAEIHVVKLLVENGADVKAVDDQGRTPLHAASNEVRRGLEERGRNIASLLIEKGADVSARTKHGWTPLHAAAQSGHLLVATLLIAEGADVNAVGTHAASTPLHTAAFWGSEKVTALLLKHGAKSDSTDKMGKTPMAIATEKKHHRIVALLKAHGTGE